MWLMSLYAVMPLLNLDIWPKYVLVFDATSMTKTFKSSHGFIQSEKKETKNVKET
jgi:hypothetical protein